MRRSAFAVLGTLVGGVAQIAKAPPSQQVPAASAPTPLWTVNTGFAQPESAYYHEPSNSIFVSNIKDYAHGFRGPGKLDGSFVTCVNGAFLEAVGARAGYHVNFAPFPYRPNSKTQILYTTRRD